MDPIALIINGFAERCKGCHRITHKRYLEMGQCPDCRAKNVKR